MNIKWEKCPSVTTGGQGGKAYFLYARKDGHRLHIVWDRYNGDWCCQIDAKVVARYWLMENARRYFHKLKEVGYEKRNKQPR